MIRVYTRVPDDPLKSNNGGDYYFWDRYFSHAGSVYKSHGTSGDFDWCPMTGKFTSCYYPYQSSCEECIAFFEESLTKDELSALAAQLDITYDELIQKIESTEIIEYFPEKV